MKYKIGDITEIIDGDRGKNYPNQNDFFTNEYCLFLDTGNVTKQGFSFENIHFITKQKSDLLRKGKLIKGDIVYTTRGTVGNVALFDNSVKYDNIRINSGMVILRVFSEKVNNRFLYQLLKHNKYRNYLKSYCTGSAQPQLPIKNFCQIEIDIPNLQTQEKIADILSKYDDLIENNQKQIKLLEEAAQRLYKKWFVDFQFPGHETTLIINNLPQGWKMYSMDDIAEYINGYAFKPSDWGEYGKPIIKIKEMNEGISKSTPRNEGKNIEEKYIIKSGDIIFAWSATLTAMIWNAEDGILNQHIFKVIPQKFVSREFVLQSIFKTLEEFKNLTTGSTMKHIQRGKLKQVFIAVPNENIMNHYIKISEPIREQILKLNKKIILLTEARDRLLPKLMNEELEV